MEGFPHPIFSSVIGERYLHKNNYCINEKDILFLDYANILYHLEENDVKQGKDKYVDRTIKQLFQGLSIQIFLTRRNISDLEDLIGRRKNGLLVESFGFIPVGIFLFAVGCIALVITEIILWKKNKPVA